jgi:hypothetical protein
MFLDLLAPPVLLRILAFTVRRVEDAVVALIGRVFFGDVFPRLLFWDGAIRLLAESLEVFIGFGVLCASISRAESAI